MKNIKIAVMAGTDVDTKMGTALLKGKGYENVVEYPISKNPEEQTVFQTSSKEYKEKIIREKLEDIKEKECKCLFVYCNSLSGAVNFRKMEDESGVKIITPMEIYREISKEYSRVAVIAANAQGLAGIEQAMFQSNSSIEVFGITLLEMVKEIERGTNPKKISEMFNFKALVNFFESLDLEGLVIGCTHFPYIKDEISKITKLKMIDPSEEMVNKL